jgi:hypothetical protein
MWVRLTYVLAIELGGCQFQILEDGILALPLRLAGALSSPLSASGASPAEPPSDLIG